MQYHLNGFRPGDPALAEAHPAAMSDEALPDTVDVLIVGSGPTGLTLAAQLAAFPNIKTRIIEQKPGRLRVGQADGIACRTMEMFEAFGFAEKVLGESYWVNETSFWKPSEEQPQIIERNGRIQDTEDGLSEFPHVILNQARIHDMYLDCMEQSPSRLRPSYSRKLARVDYDLAGGTHPLVVTVESTDPMQTGRLETVKARYLVGCDGARSSVRGAIGRTLSGDAANQAWGVMDVLAVTDFPDIRLKAVVHSADAGNLLIIPREGGYMVRLYIELDKLADNERVADRDITIEHLIAAAQKILRPYSFEVREVAWWSVYEIGQRLCNRFDDMSDAAGRQVPRVFVAGDACHTHSPKAGQGMNVSMQDAFNLGWKLATVIAGRARPELLQTYSAERQDVARELIEFDREFAKMFSARPTRSTDSTIVADKVDPAEFQRYFVRHGRFTAGTATRYHGSLITATSESQHLAQGFPIGMRFHSAPVIRLWDARPMQLGHVHKADGRWRLYAFDQRAEGSTAISAPMRDLVDFLSADLQSPLLRHAGPGTDIDAVIDVRAILQGKHQAVNLQAIPSLLHPPKGRYGLSDYEKVFCPDPRRSQDIFDLRGIDRDSGCVVVVRPDQYIAGLFAIDAHQKLADFFAGFFDLV